MINNVFRILLKVSWKENMLLKLKKIVNIRYCKINIIDRLRHIDKWNNIKLNMIKWLDWKYCNSTIISSDKLI